MKTINNNNNNNNIWLNDLFEETNYDIIETLNQGDCFFDSVRLGLLSFGIKKTIKDLRSYLIKHIDKDLFEHNKFLYESTIKELKNHKQNPIKFKLSYEEKDNMNSILEEFEFMSDLDNINDYKKYVLKKEFWANSWAISIIERSLNIKIIILSEQEYERGKIDNILQCGEIVKTDKNDIPKCLTCGLDSGVRARFEDNDESKKILISILKKHGVNSIQKSGKNILINNIDDYNILLDLYSNLPEDEHYFKEKAKNTPPKYKGYIIVTYSGNHYRLVTYKKKKYFKTEKELPVNIVELMKKTC